MEVILPTSPTLARLKRKRKSKTKFTTSDNKNLKLDTMETKPVTPMIKPAKTGGKLKPDEKKPEELGEKYPILNNEELVTKFLKVPMNNNQKGRIRQAIKESLQSTSNILVPEIIHNKIQSILKSSANLTDSELRRIRILYNLLKTALKENKVADTVKSKIEKTDKLKKEMNGDAPKVKDKDKETDGEKKDKKEQQVQKVRGPKRYIVFLGNLPVDIDKEKYNTLMSHWLKSQPSKKLNPVRACTNIMNHFSEMNEQIVDIRIPKVGSNKKSAIAYVELSNEPSYEFALSKHHSMLGNKRINVLYTAPKKGKVSKASAKSKTAKLIALQRSGKLVGSIPLAKKRSQRRLKMKKAQAKLAAENA